jgi:hypothetical protein
MAKPRTPKTLYVNNGWWMEIPTLVSPHFQTLEGVGIGTGTVDIVDAGSQIKYKFSSQVLDANEMTLTRTLDGSSDDATMNALFDRCVRDGYKFNCSFVKTHNGAEVFRYSFVGFRFVTKSDPTLDVNGEDKYLMSYTATCDYHFKV